MAGPKMYVPELTSGQLTQAYTQREPGADLQAPRAYRFAPGDGAIASQVVARETVVPFERIAR